MVLLQNSGASSIECTGNPEAIIHTQNAIKSWWVAEPSLAQDAASQKGG